MLYRAAKADPERRFHALYDKVYRRDVLERAWTNVRHNAGAAGIDRTTIADVERYGVDLLLDELAAELRAGTYRPLPARRVFIDKHGSKDKRPLSIPAVRDRIVQAAVKIVLEPVFEADFLPCSFGFRPKRGAHDALQVLIDESWRGRRWVVESDIANCFEAIPHDRLVAAVEERVCDRHVLKLLRTMLRAGVMLDGSVSHSDSGTPQGGVASPLLANIYLHRLDKAWRDGGGVGVLVRYCDDRVTRMHGRGRCRRSSYPMQCCARDGGGPSGVALQGEASNHRKLRRSRAGVVSVADKAGCQPVRYEPRRRARANHPMTGRKRIDDIKTGVESLPRDEPGGNLLTAQTVSGLKVAPARFGLWHGTCEPASRYRLAVHLTCGHPAGESENLKWQQPRGAE
jgi:retron-type reverse transcriptase